VEPNHQGIEVVGGTAKRIVIYVKIKHLGRNAK
jgi:hypothetical protein